MRRYEKAPSAGSNSDQGNRPGSFFRGGSPSRGAYTKGKGSSAHRFGRLALSLTVFAAILAFVVTTAALAATAPTADDSSVSSVTGKSALLEATINPQGAATTFHFEYGLADCAFNPCTSTPAGNAGSGETPVQLSEEISGLQAGTTYHARVVASNGEGTTNGPDMTFNTFAPAPGQNCANAGFRFGPSATLPDCRAYEMVTPIDKNGGDITTLCNIGCARTSHNQASIDGEKITYSAYKSFGDAKGSFYSNQYLAGRNESGWTNHGISPLHAGKIFFEFDPFWDLDLTYKAFTPDLKYAFLMDDANPPLTPEGVDGIGNLYKRNNLNDEFEALTRIEPTDTGGQGSEELRKQKIGEPQLAGMSQDGSHAVWVSSAIYPGVTANAKNHVFDYSNGELRLVSVLPGGAENPADAYIPAGERSHFISDDGSRIFWSLSNGSGTEGTIFVRVNNATTVPVSEPVATRAQFLSANAAGTKAFFWAGTDLYEWNEGAGTPTKIAGEFQRFYGSSDDGSYAYFVSKEDKASGATAGSPNLYILHEGTYEFIATLEPQDLGESEDPGGAFEEWYVTPSGKTIAFASHGSLTGYDNTDAVSGESDLEVFRYNTETKELNCASCAPTNTKPRGRVLQFSFKIDPSWIRRGAGSHVEWGAAWLPGLTTRGQYAPEHEIYKPRVISDDGTRVFFNSFDALVAEDTNGMQDVYEWEEQGTGGCQKADGCIGLISSGESPKDSEFVDSSTTGRDVFFTTAGSLLPQDPGLIDVYDAREGGGFPQPVTPAACEGEACQSPPNPQNPPTPASSSYNGPANVKAPAHKKKHHKKKHRKHKRHHKQRSKASGQTRHATHRNG